MIAGRTSEIDSRVRMRVTSETPARLPEPRHRALTVSESILAYGSNLATSRLLGLPTDLRFLIWEYTFGGNIVALYGQNQSPTHCILDHTNSIISDIDEPQHPKTMKNSVGLLQPYQRNLSEAPAYQNKLKVLAALQSCRTMSVSHLRECKKRHWQNTMKTLRRNPAFVLP